MRIQKKKLNQNFKRMYFIKHQQFNLFAKCSKAPYLDIYHIAYNDLFSKSLFLIGVQSSFIQQFFTKCLPWLGLVEYSRDSKIL